MKSPVLVFLHGWGGCWQSWFPVLKALEKKYTVFSPDLPGFGQEKLSRVYSLADYSDFVKKYLATNHIKNPILIGHSFGGAIICDLLIKNPRLSPKIVLVDAAPIRPLPTTKQKIISLLTSSSKKLFSLPLLSPAYNQVRKTGYKIFGLDKTDYYDITNPFLKETFTKVIRQDLSSKLNTIKAKTLIIWGENDTATPLSQGQSINRLIPNSKLTVIPKSGHFSYLDQPQIFLESLEKFIQSQ